MDRDLRDDTVQYPSHESSPGRELRQEAVVQVRAYIDKLGLIKELAKQTINRLETLSAPFLFELEPPRAENALNRESSLQAIENSLTDLGMAVQHCEDVMGQLNPKIETNAVLAGTYIDALRNDVHAQREGVSR